VSKYVPSSPSSFRSSYGSIAKPLTTLIPIRFSWNTEVISPYCCLIVSQRGRILVANWRTVYMVKGTRMRERRARRPLMETREYTTSTAVSVDETIILSPKL